MRSTCRRLLFRVDSPLRHDAGVIAVVTAIVVAFVLVPVAALGLTTYTRTSVAGEMQRAADSGALAGAAALGLLSVGSLLGPDAGAVVQSSIVNEVLAVPDTFTSLGPTGRACRAALTAFGRPVDDPARDPADRSPLSAAYASAPACDARYSPDPAFSSCVNQVFTQVNTLTAQVPDRLTALIASLLSSLLNPDNARDTRAIALSVQRLVPALAHNGVQVRLDYSVRGPLDDVFPGATDSDVRSAAAARRLFKPLLPDLASLATLTDPLGSPTLTTALATGTGRLSPVEQFTVAQLQTVVIALRILVDGVDRSALVPFLDNTLKEADELLRSLGLVSFLLNSLLGPLTAPASLPSPAALTAECLPAARDLLDDLSFALTVNRDPADQDLVPCVGRYVLGQVNLTSALPVTQACVNRVFRAQLAPTT